MALRINNPYAEFYITNGTDKIDLLGAGRQGGEGIKIEKARFRRPDRDTESIFNTEYKPVTEAYSFMVAGATQDIAIAYIRQLDQMLLQAENYFLNNYETQIVWLCSRASKESNPRYAVVYMGNIPEYADIYQQPFMSADGKAIADDLTLNIQRGIWLSAPPLTPTAKTLAVTSLATSAAYIGNRFTESMIKSVKVYDASGPTYTTYALGALNYPTGVNILPAVPAAGDILYIGVNPKLEGTVSLPDSFYLNILAGHSNTIVAEYWTGAWTALPQFVDNTAGLTQAGTISWGQNFNNWVTSTIDTVSANWMRLRVTASPSGLAPTANEIHAPRCFIEFSDVGGDLPALIDLEFTNVCDPGGAYAAETRRHTSSIYYGLRSVSRGATFIPWVNPTLSSLATAPSANTDTYNYAPVGRFVSFYCGNVLQPTVNYNFIGRVVDGVTTLVQDYVGSFRLFVRLNSSTDRTAPVLRLVLKTQADDVAKGYPYGPMSWIGPSIYPLWTVPLSVVPSLYDFGQITLGPRDLESISEAGGTPYLQLQAYLAASPSPIHHAYELFMLPVDEASGFIEDPNYALPLTVSQRLGVESASYHRRRVRSVQRAPSPSSVINGSWRSSTSGSVVVQPNSGSQRLYFISENWNDRRMACPTNMVHKVTMKVTERYLGLRGS